MYLKLLSVPVLLLTAACSPLPIVDQSHLEDKAGNEPRFGQQAEATLGSTIFSEYSYWHRSGARITAPLRQPFGQGGLFILSGETVFPSNIGQEAVWCTEHRVYIDPIAGPLSRACFSDRDNDGAFDQVKLAPESRWIDRPLDHPVPYKKSDIAVANSGAFKYELAYDGYTGQTLRLSYREFNGLSLEQPVYTQQASYEIKQFPAEITFRNVSMEVLEVDNRHIVYRVIRGF
jgi:hypothetical protein